jgi:hypothetical protein
MSAAITLLDASAEGRRAAVTNVAQGFALLARKRAIPTCQQIAVMNADNVGHLGPMRLHDANGGNLRSSESSGLGVERTATSATWR